MKLVHKVLIVFVLLVIIINFISSHAYVRSLSVVSVSLFAVGLIYSSRSKKMDFNGEDFDVLITNFKQGKKLETKDQNLKKLSDYVLNQFEEKEILVSENETLKRNLDELRKENQMLQERFGFSGHIESQNKLSFDKIGKAIHYSLQTFEKNISASNDIYNSSLNIASAIQTQYGQSEQIAGSVEEMSQNLQHTSAHTKTANDISNNAAKKALKGVKIAHDVKAGIEKVEEKSNRTKNTVEGLVKEMEQIGNVAQVIDDIADQTNLLALNAAIEAARAGEQGRGFAVVADEVRKLAERTAKATKEIAEIVRSLQGEVKYASEAMEDVDKEIKNELSLTNELTGSLKEIENETVTITDLISQITNSCAEQSEAMDTISESILKLHASIEEVNMASKSISSDTKQSNEEASRNYDKMLISVAKSDHINWVNNIVDTVVRHKEIDLNTVTNHLNCRFGKWYYSTAKERYSKYPVYRQLEPVHIAVHSKGKELLENCREKKVEDAQKCVKEIEGLRDNILQMLDELENLM